MNKKCAVCGKPYVHRSRYDMACSSDCDAELDQAGREADAPPEERIIFLKAEVKYSNKKVNRYMKKGWYQLAVDEVKTVHLFLNEIMVLNREIGGESQ